MVLFNFVNLDRATLLYSKRSLFFDNRPTRKECSLAQTPRAILFDLGNVVLRFRERKDRLWDLARLANPGKFGLPGNPCSSPDPYNGFMGKLESQGVIDTYEPGENAAWKMDTGKTTQPQIYQGFLFAAECDEKTFPPERFWMAYSADLMVIEPVAKLLEELRQRGIKLVAATNGELWSADIVFRQSGFWFDGAVMSWQVGHKKPRQEFYEECLFAARKAVGDDGLAYAECLLIDDIRANLTGFEELGGNAVQFIASKVPDTLTKELKKLRQELCDLGLLG